MTGDAGEIFTLAPRGTPRDQLYQFEAGGLSASPLLEQAHLLRRGVEAAPGAVCIVDDFDLTWGEPGSDDEANAFGVDTEVYRLLTAEDDVLAFAEVLSATHVIWHGVAAVCRVLVADEQVDALRPSEPALGQPRRWLVRISAQLDEAVGALRPGLGRVRRPG